MTWQDPGGNPAPGAPGGPGDEATRTDWDLQALDSGIGTGPATGGVPPAAVPPPGAAAPPAAAPAPAAAVPPPAPGMPPAAVPPPVPGPPATPPPSYGQPGPYGSPGAYGQPSGPGSGYGAPGGYPPPGGIWAPPPTYGTGMPGVGGLEYAGVGARFVAWLLDVVILGVIGIVISLTLTLVILGSATWTAGFASSLGQPGRVIDQDVYGRAVAVAFVAAAFSALINLAYFALQWSSGARATLGMRVVGLQIGNAADGRTLDRGQAVKRWFAMGSWLSVIGAAPVVGGLLGLVEVVWYLVLLVTTGTNARRQGLHDQFAGTAIVRKAGASDNGLVIGCVVLIVLVVLVIPLVSIVALIFLGGQVSDILSNVGTSI